MKNDFSKEPLIVEKPMAAKSGWGMLAGLVVAAVLSTVIFYFGVASESALLIVPAIILFLGALVLSVGLIAVAPNSARVMLLFGDYKGTVKDSGFFWVNPFYSKKKISLRVRNFETGAVHTPEKKDAAGTVVSPKSRTAGRPSKVNDRDGNPIDISAVVVWRVVDTAEALVTRISFASKVKRHCEIWQLVILTTVKIMSFLCEATALRLATSWSTIYRSGFTKRAFR